MLYNVIEESNGVEPSPSQRRPGIQRLLRTTACYSLSLKIRQVGQDLNLRLRFWRPTSGPQTNLSYRKICFHLCLFLIYLTNLSDIPNCLAILFWVLAFLLLNLYISFTSSFDSFELLTLTPCGTLFFFAIFILQLR